MYRAGAECTETHTENQPNDNHQTLTRSFTEQMLLFEDFSLDLSSQLTSISHICTYFLLWTQPLCGISVDTKTTTTYTHSNINNENHYDDDGDERTAIETTMGTISRETKFNGSGFGRGWW